MIPNLRLYVYLGVALVAILGTLYVAHLRATVKAQAQEVASLKADKAALEQATKALEQVTRLRTVTAQTVHKTKMEISHAPDERVPDAISIALDGLRERSKAPRP